MSSIISAVAGDARHSGIGMTSGLSVERKNSVISPKLRYFTCLYKTLLLDVVMDVGFKPGVSFSRFAMKITQKILRKKSKPTIKKGDKHQTKHKTVPVCILCAITF